MNGFDEIIGVDIGFETLMQRSTEIFSSKRVLFLELIKLACTLHAKCFQTRVFV